MKRLLVLLFACSVGLISCDTTEQPLAVDDHDHSTDVLAKRGEASSTEDFSRIIAFVDRVNEGLAASGSDVRLEYPWLFRVGPGTDPFGRLRTGSRWMKLDPTYVLDESDYTTDAPAGDVEDALVKSYVSWNDVRTANIVASRIPDNGDNNDILDGIILNSSGECVDVVDLAADNLISYDPSTGAISFIPAGDIFNGGWIGPAYFEDCLGSASILGVTWSFSTSDTDGDNYRDRLYVEQFYNEAFAWVTSGATFLGPGEDIETISLHENGHAHGLGHFGGPIVEQQFTLKPNGRLFNPEAVMNPFYLGGEKRSPLKTDRAGLTTLYGRKGN